MTSPLLNTLPDVVVSKIMEKSDWKSVITLRQVSQRLRYQVDNVSDASLPNSHLVGIEFYLDPVIQIETSFHKMGEVHRILYADTQNGKFCKGSRPGISAEFDIDEMVDIAISDLRRVLRFQKSIGYGLYLNINASVTQSPFLPGLRNFLKSRASPLKLDEFGMSCSKSSQIMAILPYLDPGFLKTIGLVQSGSSDFSFAEIMKSEQWRNAENLYLDCDLMAPVENLTHFSRVSIERMTFPAAGLNTLKNAFSRSQKFRLFCAKKVQILNFRLLGLALGTISDISGTINYWYFRTTTKDRILRIFIIEDHDGCTIKMEPIDLDEVPEGVVIKNN